MKRSLKSALYIDVSNLNNFIQLDPNNEIDSIRSAYFQNDHFLILTEKGELCKLTRFSDYETSIISKDPNKNISLSSFIEFASIKIKTLSCNSSAVLAIAEDGTLYSWGNDDGTGVLGLGSFKYRPNPTIVDPMTRFKHVSISSKHASAIDERGNLYTWGTGKLGELCDPQATFIAKPRRVDSSLLLSCQSSVCYKTVTAVITSGGSLTFFGQIGGEKYRYLNKTEPSLIQLGHTIYVVDVVVGDCFAAALTRKGEIYILSETLAHQKLNAGTTFKSVLLKNNTLYALTSDGRQLLEWDYAVKVGYKSNTSFICTDNHNQLRLNDLNEEFTKQPSFVPCSETGHPIILFNTFVEARSPRSATIEMSMLSKTSKTVKLRSHSNIVKSKRTNIQVHSFMERSHTPSLRGESKENIRSRENSNAAQLFNQNDFFELDLSCKLNNTTSTSFISQDPKDKSRKVLQLLDFNPRDNQTGQNTPKTASKQQRLDNIQRALNLHKIVINKKDVQYQGESQRSEATFKISDSSRAHKLQSHRAPKVEELDESQDQFIASTPKQISSFNNEESNSRLNSQEGKTLPTEASEPQNKGTNTEFEHVKRMLNNKSMGYLHPELHRNQHQSTLSLALPFKKPEASQLQDSIISMETVNLHKRNGTPIYNVSYINPSNKSSFIKANEEIMEFEENKTRGRKPSYDPYAYRQQEPRMTSNKSASYLGYQNETNSSFPSHIHRWVEEEQEPQISYLNKNNSRSRSPYNQAMDVSNPHFLEGSIALTTECAEDPMTYVQDSIFDNVETKRTIDNGQDRYQYDYKTPTMAGAHREVQYEEYEAEVQNLDPEFRAFEKRNYQEELKARARSVSFNQDLDYDSDKKYTQTQDSKIFSPRFLGMEQAIAVKEKPAVYEDDEYATNSQRSHESASEASEDRPLQCQRGESSFNKATEPERLTTDENVVEMEFSMQEESEQSKRAGTYNPVESERRDSKISMSAELEAAQAETLLMTQRVEAEIALRKKEEEIIRQKERNLGCMLIFRTLKKKYERNVQAALLAIYEYEPQPLYPYEDVVNFVYLVEKAFLKHNLPLLNSAFHCLAKPPKDLKETALPLFIRLDNLFRRRCQSVLSDMVNYVHEQEIFSIAKQRKEVAAQAFLRFLVARTRESRLYAVRVLRTFSLNLKKRQTRMLMTERIVKIIQRLHKNHCYSDSFHYIHAQSERNAVVTNLFNTCDNNIERATQRVREQSFLAIKFFSQLRRTLYLKLASHFTTKLQNFLLSNLSWAYRGISEHVQAEKSFERKEYLNDILIRMVNTRLQNTFSSILNYSLSHPKPEKNKINQVHLAMSILNLYSRNLKNSLYTLKEHAVIQRLNKLRQIQGFLFKQISSIFVRRRNENFKFFFETLRLQLYLEQSHVQNRHQEFSYKFKIFEAIINSMIRKSKSSSLITIKQYSSEILRIQTRKNLAVYIFKALEKYSRCLLAFSFHKMTSTVIELPPVSNFPSPIKEHPQELFTTGKKEEDGSHNVPPFHRSPNFKGLENRKLQTQRSVSNIHGNEFHTNISADHSFGDLSKIMNDRSKIRIEGPDINLDDNHPFSKSHSLASLHNGMHQRLPPNYELFNLSIFKTIESLTASPIASNKNTDRDPNNKVPVSSCNSKRNTPRTGVKITNFANKNRISSMPEIDSENALINQLQSSNHSPEKENNKFPDLDDITISQSSERRMTSSKKLSELDSRGPSPMHFNTENTTEKKQGRREPQTSSLKKLHAQQHLNKPNESPESLRRSEDSQIHGGEHAEPLELELKLKPCGGPIEIDRPLLPELERAESPEINRDEDGKGIVYGTKIFPFPKYLKQLEKEGRMSATSKQSGTPKGSVRNMVLSSVKNLGSLNHSIQEPQRKSSTPQASQHTEVNNSSLYQKKRTRSDIRISNEALISVNDLPVVHKTETSTHGHPEFASIDGPNVQSPTNSCFSSQPASMREKNRNIPTLEIFSSVEISPKFEQKHLPTPTATPEQLRIPELKQEVEKEREKEKPAAKETSTSKLASPKMKPSAFASPTSNKENSKKTISKLSSPTSNDLKSALSPSSRSNSKSPNDAAKKKNTLNNSLTKNNKTSTPKLLKSNSKKDKIDANNVQSLELSANKSPKPPLNSPPHSQSLDKPLSFEQYKAKIVPLDIENLNTPRDDQNGVQAQIEKRLVEEEKFAVLYNMYKDKDPYRAKLFQDMAKTTTHKEGKSSFGKGSKTKSPRLSGTFMTFARNSAQTEMSRTSHNQGFFIGISNEKDNFMSNHLFTLSKDSEGKTDTPKMSGRRERSESSNVNSRVK